MKVKERTPVEIIKITMCEHLEWSNHKNTREFGWNNCCVCVTCGIGCGEYYNMDYGMFKSKSDRILFIRKLYHGRD